MSGRMAGRNDMAIAGRSDTPYGHRQPGRERPTGTALGPIAGAKGGSLTPRPSSSVLVDDDWRGKERHSTVSQNAGGKLLTARD